MASISSPNVSETAASAEDAVHRAARSAHAIVDRVAETAAPAVERLLSGVSSASDKLHSGADDLGEMQERWVEGARVYVRDHPLASIGVAIAAGFVLSRLMAR